MFRYYHTSSVMSIQIKLFRMFIFLQGVFFNSGYIGAADVKVPGDFPLRLFLFAKQPVPAA